MSVNPNLIATLPAVTLAGGELVCGIALTITAQLAYTYGVFPSQLGVQNETKRQILLNLVCLIATIATIISTGFGATLASATASNVTVFASFILIQYGHVILNHNNIIRGARIVEMFWPGVVVNRDMVDWICFGLYILPPVVLIPIYFAFIDMQDTGLPMNRSVWNSKVYKPVNIALIVTSEFFAILTDVFFMAQVRANVKKNRTGYEVSRDMYAMYICTWFFVVCDIALKVIINSGISLLFGKSSLLRFLLLIRVYILADNQLSICALALRARCNMQFGLELKNLTGMKPTIQAEPVVRKPSFQAPIGKMRVFLKTSVMKRGSPGAEKSALSSASPAPPATPKKQSICLERGGAGSEENDFQIHIPDNSVLDSKQLDFAMMQIDRVVENGLATNPIVDVDEGSAAGDTKPMSF